MSSSVDSSSGISQSTLNWVIGLGIVGAYAILLYVHMHKPQKVTLADVLNNTDFNSADQCNTIFNRLMTSAQGCSDYAGASLCKACKNGLMKPLCDQSAVNAYCMAHPQ